MTSLTIYIDFSCIHSQIFHVLHNLTVLPGWICILYNLITILFSYGTYTIIITIIIAKANDLVFIPSLIHRCTLSCQRSCFRNNKRQREREITKESRFVQAPWLSKILCRLCRREEKAWSDRLLVLTVITMKLKWLLVGLLIVARLFVRLGNLENICACEEEKISP